MAPPEHSGRPGPGVAVGRQACAIRPHRVVAESMAVSLAPRVVTRRHEGRPHGVDPPLHQKLERLRERIPLQA